MGGAEVAKGAATAAAGWQARLALGFVSRGGRSVLATRRHHGPLTVQRPFYPEGEGCCHVYLLHPPGGIVGGDTLQTDIHVNAGAHALVTTPSAGKFYRCDGREGRQQQSLEVEAGATLEWLPQETIVFDGARFSGTTRVDLQGDARFIGWEVLCLGRPAAGERFVRGHGQQRFEIWRDGRPLWFERGRYAGGDGLLEAPWGLQGQAAVGTLVAVGGDTALTEALRELLAQGPGAEHFAVTRLPEVTLCRYLGPDAGEARAGFARAWARLRPALLGREACPPRIWNT